MFAARASSNAISLMRTWLILLAAIAFLTLPPTAQSQAAESPILEATNSIHGVSGHEEKRLFVRLSADGKVQWETAEWHKPNELRSTKISPELVSAIAQRLSAVDPKAFESKMGPYNRYVDTGVELFIRINTPKWKRDFSVLNPWTHSPLKPLPKELKVVICEISRLHAQVAEEPVESICVQ
jgi:hypothetical protein